MNYRELGNTGESLSVVGLGAWAIGGGDWVAGWGPQDDAVSIETIKLALDWGINWIDTAAVYGLGRSEEVVGQAIAGRRDEVFIATKCGRKADEDGALYSDLRPESIRQEAEDSLRRLGVEVIDLYQIHWPDPDGDVPLEESWGAMADLVDAGKVRYIGVSNFNVEQMQRCQAVHPIAALQPPYNLMRRDIEAEVLPFCLEHDIGVIPYSPMHSGLLTGTFHISKVAPDDWRRRAWDDRLVSRGAFMVDHLRAIAEAHEATVAQVAVAWVLRHPAITSAIVGARRPWHVEQNAGAAALVLSDEEAQAIGAALEASQDVVHYPV